MFTQSLKMFLSHFFACDVQLIADLPAVPEEANVRVNVT